jgi:hypothetical protein
MPDWLKILIPSVLGLITAIVAAIISARLAARRVFQERWWERKERAYTEIVEALHDSIQYYQIAEHEALHGNEHPKEAEFRQKQTEAYWKIKRAADIGAFVISDEAAQALLELRKKPRATPEDVPWFELFEEECENYQEALKKIRECARKDLKVK